MPGRTQALPRFAGQGCCSAVLEVLSFNRSCSGCDSDALLSYPKGQPGQSTPNATHLIKFAVQAALKQRPCTPGGTYVQHFIHVSDLARARRAALEYLRAGKKARC